MSRGRTATRRTVARHGRLRSPHPALQVLSIAGVAVLVALVSVVGIAGYHVWDAAATVARNAVDIGGDDALPPEIGAIEGGANILLVGTDSCEGQDLRVFARCGIDDDGGERNDVTMLVHISDNPRRVTVVSIPRDMVVDIPQCTGADGSASSEAVEPINASYARGGLACAAKTVEELTGEQIQFAAAIRWTGVINLSDAVGGVDVCLAGDVSDNNTGIDLTAGTHTLKGVEALQFLRMRHGIGDGSDLGRISNQQQFMSSLVRKLRSDEVLHNPATLLGFAGVALDQVRDKQLVLSSGLADPTRMVQLAMALRDVPYDEIVFVQYPTGMSGNAVLPITDAADDLFAALRENRPITLSGDASGVDALVVTGEATEPSASASSSSSPASSAPTGSPTDAATLSPSISGQTAKEITCTVPER